MVIINQVYSRIQAWPNGEEATYFYERGALLKVEIVFKKWAMNYMIFFFQLKFEAFCILHRCFNLSVCMISANKIRPCSKVFRV
jgi:hypothetical protein